MADYIERQAAIEGAKTADLHILDEYDVIKAIEAIPAADVRHVVRGEWRKIGKIGCIFVCSACDKTFPCKTDFCPNCGADMREES